MKVAVDYGNGVRVEVEVHHTLTDNGEVYRSIIHTNPVTKKRCYVEYEPKDGKVKVVEVK